MRASSVVKRQLALVWLALRLSCQAATSLVRVSLSGMRRSRHWLARNAQLGFSQATSTARSKFAPRLPHVLKRTCCGEAVLDSMTCWYA